MKLILTVFAILFAIAAASASVIIDPKSNPESKTQQLKVFIAKLEAEKDPENSPLIHHILQFGEFYEKNNNKATDAEYVGCYKDHRYQRMFRGYAEISISRMTNEHCITQCRNYRFAYAGSQSGDQCYCGDSAPETQYNAKLNEGDCKDNCKGDKTQKCGAGWISSVYRTGIHVYRYQNSGNSTLLEEPSSYSHRTWERK